MTIRGLVARLLGTTDTLDFAGRPMSSGRQVHPPATRARPQQPDSRRIELHARLAALTEVHEFYEFDALDETQFDAWLHEQIKRVRAQLGIAEVPRA